jgi:hypothetical protein
MNVHENAPFFFHSLTWFTENIVGSLWNQHFVDIPSMAAVEYWLCPRVIMYIFDRVHV